VARLNRNQGEEGGDNRLPSYPTNSPSVAPEVTTEIINYLNAKFPDTLPPAGSAYTEVERAWGRREVIEHLIWRQKQNEEENNVLRRRIDSPSSAGPGTTAAASG
jgi:hypothetical protein